MISLNPFIFISTQPYDGALMGIFPLYGIVILSNDEYTFSLSFDITADEMKYSLELFYSTCSVYVTKDNYGILYSYNKSSIIYLSCPWIFSIWTIYFNGSCSGNMNGIAFGNCPSSLGVQPIIPINKDGILFVK